ncbi:uncharacterized protein SOCE26_041500 [Sorangium cellulosum]|uniref:Uncharacterized protein n=1 Tax=Sorangium cellulosum TaxID=56 RepID=A0A2L0ETT3_SORCE|nr:uncharacterized protein SOCE26_041500 [Sorangium cellulosum]
MAPRLPASRVKSGHRPSGGRGPPVVCLSAQLPAPVCGRRLPSRRAPRRAAAGAAWARVSGPARFFIPLQRGTRYHRTLGKLRRRLAPGPA